MPPIPIGKLLAEIQENIADGFCNHPTAPVGCGSKIVRAHTVQRNGGLSAIAEDGHVLSPKAGLPNLHKNDGFMVPTKVGVKSASTFLGFCDNHDSSMFRPAEFGTVAVSDEVAFLFAFRAMAYEGFAKIAIDRRLTIQREADRGQPFERQAEIQMLLHWQSLGTKLALEDFIVWRKLYNDAYLSKDYSMMWYHAIEFDGILPFAGCGAVYPEFDFNGVSLQWIGSPSNYLQHVTFNLTVLDGRSVLVFGWLGEESGSAASFVNSIAALADKDVADAIVRFAFEHIENTCLRPSWWNALDPSTRQAMLRRLRSAIVDERKAHCLMPDGQDYMLSAKVDRRISRLQV